MWSWEHWKLNTENNVIMNYTTFLCLFLCHFSKFTFSWHKPHSCSFNTDTYHCCPDITAHAKFHLQFGVNLCSTSNVYTLTAILNNFKKQMALWGHEMTSGDVITSVSSCLLSSRVRQTTFHVTQRHDWPSYSISFVLYL